MGNPLGVKGLNIIGSVHPRVYQIVIAIVPLSVHHYEMNHLTMIIIRIVIIIIIIIITMIMSIVIIAIIVNIIYDNNDN